jgi:hypothetical protein
MALDSYIDTVLTDIYKNPCNKTTTWNSFMFWTSG